MNYNLLSYLVYAVLMSTIIIRVGSLCYRNGNVYVSKLMPDNLELSIYINKVLLAGYYLVNIGYTVYMISTWDTIKNGQEMISHIATHASQIILLLALLHYMNIIGIQLLFNKKSILTSKS